MKTLVIVRHGKAEVHKSGMSDFERNLAKRGKREAPMMAEIIKERGLQADFLISSPANRAYQTAQNFAKVFGYPEENILTRDFIYGYFPPDKLLYLIEEHAPQADTVFVFGHNPTFEEMAGDFCPAFQDFLPTSGSVGVVFHVNNWSEVDLGKGKLLFFEYPKKYK